MWIEDKWNNFTYFFRRKRWQIKRLIEWFPIIWKSYDFDYRYALDIFAFQLERQAEFMSSDRAHTVEAKYNAQRIRLAIRLMKKVYDEDYACEYQHKLIELYGKEAMDFKFVPTERNDGSSYLKCNYELTETEERINEINEMRQKLFDESQKKQEKAHKLLWKIVEQNIRGWWD